jgi:hypothetical protein
MKKREARHRSDIAASILGGIEVNIGQMVEGAFELNLLKLLQSA